VNLERKVPGESLSHRLDGRRFRRPRIGFSPAFYARWGLQDPWTDLSSGSLADLGPGESTWSYLSDRDYQDHLRRLGFQRWQRDKRMEDWLPASAKKMLSTGDRRIGASASGSSFFGRPSLALLESKTPALENSEPSDIQRSGPRALGTPTASVENPWGVPRAHSKARVAVKAPGVDERAGNWIGAMAPQVAERHRARPLDSVTARLVVQDAPSILARTAMPRPSVMAGSAGPKEDVEGRGGEISPARRRRRMNRLRRQLGPVARLIEPELQHDQGDSELRPSSIARSRIGTSVQRKRGLRPVMHRSPTMAALDASAPELVRGDHAEMAGALPGNR